MDLKAAVERAYEHLEADRVANAVMVCLRIARNLHDYLYAAIFLREMHPVGTDLQRTLYDEMRHLNEDARKLFTDRSLALWLECRTLEFSIGISDDGEERNVFAIGVGEIDPEIEQAEHAIQDMALPSGMGEYDTAAFTDRYSGRKVQFRLRITALHTIRERIKTRCLNYAINVERQLESQLKARSFLEDIQNDVNNYFKARSEDVYTKLQKASQLIDCSDSEDCALLLTEVRRAIKASADFFYPPAIGQVVCSDGKTRDLGDEQYLNRLEEYLATAFKKSASRDLLRAEFNHLAIVARKLNDVASKGVHANVSTQEAKQGLLGLYMFLFNLVSRLQEEPQEKAGD